MEFNHPLAELIDDQLGADFPIEDPIPAKPVLWAAGIGLLAWMLLRKSDTEGQALSAEVKEKIVYMNERLIPAQEIAEELKIDIKDVESVISEKKIKLELPERKRHFITAPLGVQLENPRTPIEYIKMFDVLRELEKSSFSSSFELSDVSSEHAMDVIIGRFKKNDRIDTFFLLFRFLKLSRYFKDLSEHIRKVASSELPNERKFEIIKNIINDPFISKAFSIWKHYYYKMNHYDLSHPLNSRPFTAASIIMEKDFPEGSWQRKLLGEYYGGDWVFGQAFVMAKEYLEALEHYINYINMNHNFRAYAGSLVWEPYDIVHTIHQLRAKEDEFREMGDTGKHIAEAAHDTVFLDMGDWKWIVADPEEESRMMKHCARERTGATLLSLRHYDKKKGMVIAHVTAAYYQVNLWGFITQMKGKSNQKPSFKYHPYIISLLKDDRVQFKLPGDYKPEADFQFEDLEKEQLDDLKQAKPQLFSLIEFKKKNGMEETIALLRKFNIGFPGGARIDGDTIIFDEWDSEEDFLRGIYRYVSRDTRKNIEMAWEWIDEQYINIDWTPERAALVSLYETLKAKNDNSYLNVAHYLKTLYPDKTTDEAFEEIIDDKNESMAEAFYRAEHEGFAIGWRDNAYQAFWNTLDQFSWDSGAFINISHRPFKISIMMQMEQFDKLLQEPQSMPDILGQDDGEESEFEMPQVQEEYNEEAALEYLAEIGIPEAMSSLEGSLKNVQKKIFREEMKKIGARQENIEEENPLELTERQIEWAKEGVEGIAFYKIDPKEFLQLTTDSMGEREYIKERAKPLEVYNSEEFKKGYSVHPHLTIAPSGKIVTHEGRHRAAALVKKGESEMPIVIVARESEYLDPGFGWRWKRQLPVPNYLYAQYPAGDPNTYRHTIDKSKIEIIKRTVSPNPIEENPKIKAYEWVSKIPNDIKESQRKRILSLARQYAEARKQPIDSLKKGIWFRISEIINEEYANMTPPMELIKQMGLGVLIKDFKPYKYSELKHKTYLKKPITEKNPITGGCHERFSMGSRSRGGVNDSLSKALKKYTKGRGRNRNAKDGSNRRTRKIGKSPKRGSDGRFTKRS